MVWKGVAERLFLTEVIVKNYAGSIIGKLQASDRTHAVITALGLGQVELQGKNRLCLEPHKRHPTLDHYVKGDHMAQTACHLEKVITRTISLDYLLHLPVGYESGGPWPLILFLHGAGERGSDLNLLYKHPLPAMLEGDASELPFVVVSPQCPSDNWWPMMGAELLTLLDDVEARYNTDRQRVYLTGLSMGGFGSWALGAAHPERFAAVAPICGGYHGPAAMVRALKDTPVWAFHGAKDPVVPVEQTVRLVQELRQAGGDVRLTVYPELEHDSWTVTYHNPALYDWFLSHTNK